MRNGAKTAAVTLTFSDSGAYTDMKNVSSSLIIAGAHVNGLQKSVFIVEWHFFLSTLLL